MSVEIARDLFAFEANQASYTDISELVADWEVTIIGPTDFGWNAGIMPPSIISYYPGSVGIGNVGGVYGIDYDFWEFIDSETVGISYQVSIPVEQFEYDMQPGYDPSTDASIVIPEKQLFSWELIIGSASKGHYRYDLTTSMDEIPYVVIPEYSSYGSWFSLAIIGWVVLKKLRPKLWRWR